MLWIVYLEIRTNKMLFTVSIMWQMYPHRNACSLCDVIQRMLPPLFWCGEDPYNHVNELEHNSLTTLYHWIRYLLTGMDERKTTNPSLVCETLSWCRELEFTTYNHACWSTTSISSQVCSVVILKQSFSRFCHLLGSSEIQRYNVRV
jgi:hypothetical protein